MTSQLAAWGDLVVGNYAYDQNDVLWRIDAELDGWLRLTNRAGKEVHTRRPALDRAVRIPVVTEAQAVRTIHAVLGGTVIAVEETP